MDVLTSDKSRQKQVTILTTEVTRSCTGGIPVSVWWNLIRTPISNLFLKTSKKIKKNTSILVFLTFSII